MISWQGDDDPAPAPEELTAYADGELDDSPQGAALRRRIETWLARHPEASAEVQGQRALTPLWEATSPPEPSEASWANVLARLDRVPLTPPPTSARRFSLRALAAWSAATVAAVAAALWLSLVLLWPVPERQLVRQVVPRPGPRPPVVQPQPVPEPIEPFPVATGDEVEVLSIRGADTETLVVGELPLDGPMVLVAAGEVEVKRAEPEVRMGGGGPPMLWTPLDRERTEP
jgi:hypothetical protein